MKSSLEISVIIPIFNRSHFLKKTLTHILKQSFRPREVIIIDDGSSDDESSLYENILWSLLDDIPQHASYVCLKMIKISQSHYPLGVAAARSYGAFIAQSPWIAFCDSDDLWPKNKLANQMMNHMYQKELYLWSHGEEKWFRNDQFINSHKKHQKCSGDVYKRSLDLCAISPSALIVYRQWYVRTSPVFHSLPVCEDYGWNLLTSLFFPVALTPKVILHKIGGHQCQLSQEYVGMDYFRLQAKLCIMQWMITLLERDGGDLFLQTYRHCKKTFMSLDRQKHLSPALYGTDHIFVLWNDNFYKRLKILENGFAKRSLSISDFHNERKIPFLKNQQIKNLESTFRSLSFEWIKSLKIILSL
jgi:glycosyltransferase involved in cell wall biosynthesis